MEPWDVTIVGGGILGTSLAYWLAQRYEGRIALLEREPGVALHTSHRNTGVIHRPFYLDPKGRRVVARCSQVAYGLWKEFAARRGLPWKTVSTLEVATSEDQVPRLEKYFDWGRANGMGEDELELLGPSQVQRLEPNVRCHGAIWSKTDTAVDYQEFTEALREDAERAGARFLLDAKVDRIDVAGDVLEVHVAPSRAREIVALDPRNRIRVRASARREPIRTRFLMNAAGGHSIDIAHMLGVGTVFTDLHFRGEYWQVHPKWHFLSSRNIYTVPRHPELPFLDPHWIVRADGRREIGPNAVPVAGPYTYDGFFDDPAEAVRKFFEPPVRNKLALFVNPDFVTMAVQESASSISRRVMAGRVRKFLPRLRVGHLTQPGTAGVRASVIDRRGNFVKEAVELIGPRSFHITNYNSPGATGAPAYTAWLVNRLASAGHLDHLKRKNGKTTGLWDLDSVCSAIEGPRSESWEAMAAVHATGS